MGVYPLIDLCAIPMEPAATVRFVVSSSIRNTESTGIVLIQMLYFMRF